MESAQVCSIHCWTSRVIVCLSSASVWVIVYVFRLELRCRFEWWLPQLRPNSFCWFSSLSSFDSKGNVTQFRTINTYVCVWVCCIFSVRIRFCSLCMIKAPCHWPKCSYIVADHQSAVFDCRLYLWRFSAWFYSDKWLGAIDFSSLFSVSFCVLISFPSLLSTDRCAIILWMNRRVFSVNDNPYAEFLTEDC